MEVDVGKCPRCMGCGKVPNPECNHAHRARRFIRCPECKGTGKSALDDGKREDGNG